MALPFARFVYNRCILECIGIGMDDPLQVQCPLVYACQEYLYDPILSEQRERIDPKLLVVSIPKSLIL